MPEQKKKNIRIMPQFLITAATNIANGIADLFVALKFTPNTLTVIALLFGVGAGVLFALDKPGWAGLMIFLCGLFDMLDGKVAAKTNATSDFGAIFDSTLDRYSEFFIYLGLAYHFKEGWALWVPFFTFLGSTMVSYTRARAEGLGIECKIGVMQRAERMVLLLLGTIIGIVFGIFDPLMTGILLFIAVISNFTALQRTFYVRKVTKQQGDNE
jgi:CDP-diacylglycerol--glycerol-3-phosphate 3-phosphatidyltransferase